MMKIVLIFSLFLFIGCNEKVENVLDNSTELIAKYQTLDEKISPNHSKCSDIVHEFEKMDKYDCSFKIDNYEFDIEKKFVLDKNGNLNEYWTYKAEGPLTYSLEELESDPKFLEIIGGTELNITLSQDGKYIWDNGDTLEIEKIFSDQNLILIKQSGNIKRNGRRLLFEYK
jgi:hypothetical protein